jgi:hypothetical protein
MPPADAAGPCSTTPLAALYARDRCHPLGAGRRLGILVYAFRTDGWCGHRPATLGASSPSTPRNDRRPGGRSSPPEPACRPPTATALSFRGGRRAGARPPLQGARPGPQPRLPDAAMAAVLPRPAGSRRTTRALVLVNTIAVRDTCPTDRLRDEADRSAGLPLRLRRPRLAAVGRRRSVSSPTPRRTVTNSRLTDAALARAAFPGFRGSPVSPASGRT